MTINVKMCIHAQQNVDVGLLADQIQSLLDAGLVNQRVHHTGKKTSTVEGTYLLYEIELNSWDDISDVFSAISNYIPKVCRSDVCPRTDYSCPAYRQ